MTTGSVCRSCGASLSRTFLDLGTQPLANSYLTESQVRTGDDPTYPLHVRVCDSCLLVQIDDVVPPGAIFSDYAYFSSYSESWVEHARQFATLASSALGLGPDSLVMEVASNDGYLLRHFVDLGIPVQGIDPAANVAEVAIAAGIPTEVRFFGPECAGDLVARGCSADLVVANNVLAHVPALNDFVASLTTVLAPDGVVTVEFPHLLELIDRVEFDTIYHEHLCYYSLLALEPLFARHGLRVINVERLPTHGGSLRVWAAHTDTHRPTQASVAMVRDAETAAGLGRPEGYEGFAPRVDHVLNELRGFLDEERRASRVVAAYGAAAKGNTLLNACAATTQDISFVVDRNPHKQGLFMPGSHLPILHPDEVTTRHPETLLLLAWNLRSEIIKQMEGIRQWGGRFAVPIPSFELIA